MLDRKLAQLSDERAALQARLAELNGQIASLAGPVAAGRPKAAPAPKVKAKVKRKVARKAAGRVPAGPKPARGARGPRGGLTLGNTMVDLLTKAGKPMQVRDLVAAVQASDYPSKSPHLRSMANQTLSKDARFRKVRRGLYKLA